jgi:hypothetical protein
MERIFYCNWVEFLKDVDESLKFLQKGNYVENDIDDVIQCEWMMSIIIE